MPLKINLKKGQKVILNGAVIENNNPRSISFTLMNEASILRDSDVMAADDACTPASRVYFAAQGLYLFPNNQEQYLSVLSEFLDDYEKAANSSKPIINEIREKISSGEYYAALRQARKLIEHESKVLTNVQKSVTELRDGTD